MATKYVSHMEMRTRKTPDCSIQGQRGLLVPAHVCHAVGDEKPYGRLVRVCVEVALREIKSYCKTPMVPFCVDRIPMDASRFRCHGLSRWLTDQALSCRPPVKIPRPLRRAPAESTPNRAAAGWKPRQADPAAAGQLQCLVRQRPRDGVCV
jgi:hypothetical protein